MLLAKSLQIQFRYFLFIIFVTIWLKLLFSFVMLTYLSSFSKFRAELKKLKKLQQYFLGLNIEKLFSQL